MQAWMAPVRTGLIERKRHLSQLIFLPAAPRKEQGLVAARRLFNWQQGRSRGRQERHTGGRHRDVRQSSLRDCASALFEFPRSPGVPGGGSGPVGRALHERVNVGGSVGYVASNFPRLVSEVSTRMAGYTGFFYVAALVPRVKTTPRQRAAGVASGHLEPRGTCHKMRVTSVAEVSERHDQVSYDTWAWRHLCFAQQPS